MDIKKHHKRSKEIRQLFPFENKWKKTDKSDMQTDKQLLKKLCQSFLHFTYYTKKASQHSLRAYTTDLRELFEFKKEELSLSNKTPFIDIQDKKKLEKTVQHFIEKSTAKHLKLANSSRSRKLAAVKSFIKWLSDHKHIDEDFRHVFKAPKVSRRVPSFLSVDEVFSILEMFKKEENKIHTKRDKALFFLLYGAGLRVSEACELKNSNIDFGRRTIKIKGKGSKERLVSFPKNVLNHLKVLKTNSVFFFGDKALPQRKAYDIIRSIGKKAGLLKPLHPHSLRHSFATHMLLGGTNLRVLQKLLGHKSLTSTQKYTHLDLAGLAQTLEKYHPLHQKNQLF